MTGRYQQRHGWEFNPACESNPAWTQDSNLADMLKESGYTTGMVGKWHLGYLSQFHPLNRGFDHYFGVLVAVIFIDQSRPDVESIGNWPQTRSSKGVYDGHKLIEVEDYSTDVFTDRAVDFIKQKHRRSFFTSVTQPHIRHYKQQKSTPAATSTLPIPPRAFTPAWWHP